MAKYEIIIDNLAVFVGEQKARHDCVLPISFTVDGKTLEKSSGKIIGDAHHAGLSVRTQITPKDSTHALEKILGSGKDVLILSVSSGISESFSTAEYIANGLKIKYPDRRIIVIDTLSCGAGEGLLYSLALNLQKDGLDIEQVANRLQEAKQKLHHVFITNDFSALSNNDIIAQTAIVNIKPIFDISKGGKVCVLQKTMGNKKAISDIVKYVVSSYDKDINYPLLITYGGKAEAQNLYDNIATKLPDALIEFKQENEFVSAYIGADAVCICFFGESRKA